MGVNSKSIQGKDKEGDLGIERVILKAVKGYEINPVIQAYGLVGGFPGNPPIVIYKTGEKVLVYYNDSLIREIFALSGGIIVVVVTHNRQDSRGG